MDGVITMIVWAQGSKLFKERSSDLWIKNGDDVSSYALSKKYVSHEKKTALLSIILIV